MLGNWLKISVLMAAIVALFVVVASLGGAQLGGDPRAFPAAS